IDHSRDDHERALALHVPDHDQDHHTDDRAGADRREQDAEAFGALAEDVAREDGDEGLVMAEDGQRGLDPEDERQDRAGPYVAEPADKLLANRAAWTRDHGGDAHREQSED